MARTTNCSTINFYTKTAKSIYPPFDCIFKSINPLLFEQNHTGTNKLRQLIRQTQNLENSFKKT